MSKLQDNLEVVDLCHFKQVFRAEMLYLFCGAVTQTFGPGDHQWMLTPTYVMLKELRGEKDDQ